MYKLSSSVYVFRLVCSCKRVFTRAQSGTRVCHLRTFSVIGFPLVGIQMQRYDSFIYETNILEEKSKNFDFSCLSISHRLDIGNLHAAEHCLNATAEKTVAYGKYRLSEERSLHIIEKQPCALFHVVNSLCIGRYYNLCHSVNHHAGCATPVALPQQRGVDDLQMELAVDNRCGVLTPFEVTAQDKVEGKFLQRVHRPFDLLLALLRQCAGH